MGRTTAIMMLAPFLMIGLGPGISTTSGQELATLKGHEQEVTSVAFSPDGKLLVSGSVDQTVRIWDVQKRKVQNVLKGHEGAVHAVAFSADGKLVVSAGRDRTLRVWNVQSGEQVRSLEHDASVEAVTFTPDGKTMISASQDHTIRLWAVDSGEEEDVLTGHQSYIRSVAVDGAGKTLISVAFEFEKPNEVFVWDLKARKLQTQLKGIDFHPDCVRFSPDGKAFAVSGSVLKLPSDIKGALRIWDVASGAERVQCKQLGFTVKCLVYAPDGKTLAAPSYEGIGLWDPKTGNQTAAWETQSGRVAALAYSTDGKLLASGEGGGENSIKLWKGAGAGSPSKATGSKPKKK